MAMSRSDWQFVDRKQVSYLSVQCDVSAEGCFDRGNLRIPSVTCYKLDGGADGMFNLEVGRVEKADIALGKPRICAGLHFVPTSDRGGWVAGKLGGQVVD